MKGDENNEISKKLTAPLLTLAMLAANFLCSAGI